MSSSSSFLSLFFTRLPLLLSPHFVPSSVGFMASVTHSQQILHPLLLILFLSEHPSYCYPFLHCISLILLQMRLPHSISIIIISTVFIINHRRTLYHSCYWMEDLQQFDPSFFSFHSTSFFSHFSDLNPFFPFSDYLSVRRSLSFKSFIPSLSLSLSFHPFSLLAQ